MKIKILTYNNTQFDNGTLSEQLKGLSIEYSVEYTKSITEFESSLCKTQPNIILSTQPIFKDDRKEALQIRNKLFPSTPFIFITNHVELEICIDLLKQGVTDIVLTQENSSLAQKITRAIKEGPLLKFNALGKQSLEKFTDKFSLNESIGRSFIANTMDAILFTEKNGKILEANAAACELLKLTKNKIFRSKIFDFIAPSDSRLCAHLDDCNRTGYAVSELMLKRKDGSYFLCEVTTILHAGVIDREIISMTIRDLTINNEREQQLAYTRLELKEALSVLHKIMNAAMDLIYSINSEKIIVHINGACKQIIGYEPQELIGKKYSDLLHPDDQESTFIVDQDVQDYNPIKLFENRLIHKNGTIINIMLSARWDDVEQLIYCTAKDITEKKHLEKAYLMERQLFIDIYNNAPSCMGLLKGPNHVYELANPLYLKLINRKDIIGKTVMEVLPELKSQGIFELLDTVYATGKPFIANEMLFKLDFNGNGVLEDKYLNFLYQAHRDIDDNIDGILFFAIDVTEQVLSRMKIEESEKLYRQLISELPVAAYSCDAEGKITFYNKAVEALWGKKPEIGKDLFCGFTKIFDHMGQLTPHNMCPMAIALNEGKTISGYEGTIENAIGETRIIIPHAVPFFDSSGNVTGAVNMLTDVTQSRETLKALELRNKELADYKYALDESSIVGITNRKGIIIYANENFCKISKYRLEELIGQDHKIINSGYHSKAFMHNLWRTIISGNTWKGELKNKAKDGSYYWVDTTITPFLDEKGQPYQYVATRFDITERKLAELNLERQNKELIKANLELDRFVYSVSHDLRSPLTSVQGLISIIQDESNEPDTLEHVEMINNSITRLDEFIRNILSYSQNNRTGLVVEKIPVKNCIRNVVHSLQNMVQAKGIHFIIDVQELTSFYTDKIRFNRILENLISNAIKYHKSIDSDRNIIVKGVVDENILKLKITDNGIGIPQQYLTKIFDMFFRISSKSEGSGIGLYIVKDTVEKLNGTIQVHSQVEVGTTFDVHLKNLKQC